MPTSSCIYDMNKQEDRDRYAAEQLKSRQCFERFQRCRNMLDSSRSRQQIITWLDCLQPAERERCRQVLNDIKNGRRAKAEMNT